MDRTTASGDEREVRLMLVGKTGAGASASANTILGRDSFKSARSFSSVTTVCQSESACVADRTIKVIDTPNFFNSYCNDIRSEFERGMKISSTGVQALLLVFALDASTKQDVLKLYKETFGEEALRYTIVLFTHGDQLLITPIYQQIGRNKELSALVDECGGRYHVLNNKDLANKAQVTELLEKIDKMVVANGNSCYTLEMFHSAQSLRAYCKRAVHTVMKEKPHYVICGMVIAVGVFMYRTRCLQMF